MDSYVFANQKGGVGKTTVTLGVASALAGRAARALLVDLDLQASATKVLGLQGPRGCSMADVMLDPDRYTLTDAIAETEWGFDAVPLETALASRDARRSTADEFVLREQFARVNGYDVVLVDCPPSLGVLTLNDLAAAAHLVVVTEPSFVALQGIDERLETHDLVNAHYNAGRRRLPQDDGRGAPAGSLTLPHHVDGAGVGAIASRSPPARSHHMLVCRGRRCSAAHAAALAAALQVRGLDDDDVLVTRPGCVQPCNRGSMFVVHPGDAWYGAVTPDLGLASPTKHLVAGQPVAYGVIPRGDANGS